MPVYTYDASISTNTREWKSFHSLVLVLMLASLRRTCKPARRKHKHKRKHKALMLASHRFTRRFLVLVLMLAWLPVVRVNWHDASISTSASTRRLCLLRTGLHVGFLCLCLCLRRTCKPGLTCGLFNTMNISWLDILTPTLIENCHGRASHYARFYFLTICVKQVGEKRAGYRR